jgi:pyruvate kinase
MLSFVESIEDVWELEEAIVRHGRGSKSVKECEIVWKIESADGVDFVRGFSKKHFSTGSPHRLMAARDDLMIHIGVLNMVDVLKMLVAKDPNAICASRLLMGLERGEVSMADVSDIEYMRSLGYKCFMLSDGISREQGMEALEFWRKYSARRSFK